jgi:SWI/SNF-related matrix-associated actin-dependent regulator of chromatin subfamily A-like protein 1
MTNDKSDASADVVIVGWPALTNNALRAKLLARSWGRLVLDEAHAAKNFEAKRTQAVFGVPMEDGAILARGSALTNRAEGTWCLTGTPIPNAPNDLYPMMRTLCQERLLADAARGWPDVTKYQDFLHRYCVVRMKKISNFNRIPVVIGGKNLDELAARLEGFFLRRTQADVGITEPIFETLPLLVSAKDMRAAEGDANRVSILEAAKAGNTKALEMHLGPLRRITGEIVARGVIETVRDEFAGGLDRIVLAYWHKDVGVALREGLAEFGVLQIDGSTAAAARGDIEQAFLRPDGPRVMLAQIQAAGEAVDFSSANELIFVETSFQPKDMAQMAMRITNHTQKRQPRVRVAVLQGSIQEAMEEVLIRKWSAIREVLQPRRD